MRFPRFLIGLLPAIVLVAIFTGCSGGGNNGPVTPALPTVTSFSATPGTINQGQTSTLSWVVAGASSLTINNAVGVVTGTSVTVNPATTTTYTLTAANSAGTASGMATVTVNPAPSFTLTANPSVLSLVAGSTGNTTLSVTPLNGFTGAVTFTLTGMPSGVVPTFAPNPATSSSLLSLQVAPSVALATYPMVIHGNAPGLTEQTASLSLTVTPIPTPDFFLSMAAPPSIQAGNTGTTSVTATRSNGHSAPITLSIENNAQGITGSGTIASGSSSGTLTFNVPSNVSANTYALTADGTDGNVVRSTTGNLTVTPIPAAVFVLALNISEGAVDLYSVVPTASGTDTRIGMIATAAGQKPGMTDLALTPDGSIYAVSFSQLYHIDKTTALAVPIGSSLLPSTNGLASDRNGNLFGGTNSTGSLISINKNNGTYSVIGSFGSGYLCSGDLAFSPTGTLFATVLSPSSLHDILVTVNPTTGVATRINSSTDTGTGAIFGLCFVGSQLFGFSNDIDGKGSIWLMDTNTGVATFVRKLQFAVYGSGLRLPN